MYPNNDSAINTISLEQEFKLQVLSLHIQNLSQEQLRKLLLKAVRQSICKDNLIKRLKLETQVTDRQSLDLTTT
jgi:hypothetical protein